MGKGDRFERQTCRVLSLWWTNNLRDDILWRNRRHRTNKNKDVKHQLGDVTTIDSSGLPLIETFNIELKSGYSKTRTGKKVKNIPWDVLDLIDYSRNSGANPLLQFWEQTTTDARISGRLPLLIFKRDYHYPVVCITRETLNPLKEFLGSPDFSYVTYKTGEITLYMFRLEEFLEWITPEVVKLLHARRCKIEPITKS